MTQAVFVGLRGEWAEKQKQGVFRAGKIFPANCAGFVQNARMKAMIARMALLSRIVHPGPKSYPLNEWAEAVNLRDVRLRLP